MAKRVEVVVNELKKAMEILAARQRLEEQLLLRKNLPLSELFELQILAKRLTVVALQVAKSYAIERGL